MGIFFIYLILYGWFVLKIRITDTDHLSGLHLTSTNCSSHLCFMWWTVGLSKWLEKKRIIPDSLHEDIYGWIFLKHPFGSLLQTTAERWQEMRERKIHQRFQVHSNHLNPESSLTGPFSLRILIKVHVSKHKNKSEWYVMLLLLPQQRSITGIIAA